MFGSEKIYICITKKNSGKRFSYSWFYYGKYETKLNIIKISKNK